MDSTQQLADAINHLHTTLQNLSINQAKLADSIDKISDNAVLENEMKHTNEALKEMRSGFDRFVLRIDNSDEKRKEEIKGIQMTMAKYSVIIAFITFIGSAVATAVIRSIGW